MMQTKVIRVTAKTYSDLANRGTLKDTFDTVIQKLLNSEMSIQHKKNGGFDDEGFAAKPSYSSIRPRTAAESDPGYE